MAYIKAISEGHGWIIGSCGCYIRSCKCSSRVHAEFKVQIDVPCVACGGNNQQIMQTMEKLNKLATLTGVTEDQALDTNYYRTAPAMNRGGGAGGSLNVPELVEQIRRPIVEDEERRERWAR